MSEKLHVGHEALPDNIDTSVEVQRNLERLQEAAEQAEHDPLKAQAESLRESAKQEAVSGQELNVGDLGTENSRQTFGTDKALKADAYKRSLRRIRTSLNPAERTFSKVVHNKAIDSTSNVAAKTVARPSAFLGAGFGALAGSSLLLYMARQYGFTYNYTVFLLTLAVGLVVGLLLELLWRVTFGRKRS